MYIRILTLTTFLGLGTAAMAQSPFDALQSIATSLESAIREQSQASNRPSMAMIDRETARSMNYDNQIKHVQTYFDKRNLNKSYRQAGRRSAQQITATVRRNAPDRLSVQQYDAYQGRINWPVVIRDSAYETQRQSLDKLFAAHARSGGGINTIYYAQIQEAIATMRRQLEGNVNSMDVTQYGYSSKFLTSLRYEARFAVGS